VTATPRVAIVQGQARSALRLAAAFGAAAAVAIVAPHRTGAWLPLHLFLVGSVLLAVSGAARLFAVTWSAGEPAGTRLVTAQRWLIAAGAAGLAVGREGSLPVGALAAAGLCVTAGLVLLAVLLSMEVRRGRVRRFRPALHFYLAALGFGVVGTGLGAALVTGSEGLRDAHVTVNLLGLVGLVIAGTLPFFIATQARMKRAPRATPGRLHTALGVLAVAVVAAGAAEVAHRPAVAGVALTGYVAGLVYLVTLLPVPGSRQWRWAGPRLLQLGLGVAWWAAVVAVAAGRSLAGWAAFPEPLVVTLVIGGFLQILVASLAYLAPVLRGGGHQQLSAGLRATRSWVALVAGNLAALAWIGGQHRLADAGLVVVAVDVAARAARLARDAQGSASDQDVMAGV
jgi:nitrite reductase (NO-forming)